LKHGVKSSRNAQLKSERLKTELITNVSHDLRTPLTSIITYNDLLRKSDVSDEERQDYLAIIDRKAKRLKRLIDDLFDASKMASGAIELHKTKVNLNELLTQALAEYDEAIQQSKLNFRIKTPDEGVPVIVDGQKLWRVFDNMIGNILKYSMEGTRVYITLEVKNGEATATFKNITKYELGDNVDELFERFKRGDASRHTEGSGLGLAIAKSIIDLHDGVFEIDLDGDLFKVVIRLPIA
jgi:signal transduction histidine kinase